MSNTEVLIYGGVTFYCPVTSLLISFPQMMYKESLHWVGLVGEQDGPITSLLISFLHNIKRCTRKVWLSGGGRWLYNLIANLISTQYQKMYKESLH